MLGFFQNIKLEKVLKIFLKAFLFLLPWQTVYIFQEVFLNGIKIESWTLNFYATEILLWLIVLVFLFWYWKNFKFQISNFKFQISRDRIFIFSVLLFIIYHLSSIMWATDKSLALQQSLRVMEVVLLFFIIFLGPLKSKEVVKYLLLGSLLPAVLGIGQFLLQNTFAFKWLGLVEHISHEPGASVIVGENIGRWLRAYGPFTHPNVFGGFLVLVLILVTYHLLPSHSASRHITYHFSKKAWYVLCGMCYVIITALFFTFSRSAWLAVFIGLIVILSYCYIVIKRRDNIKFIIYPRRGMPCGYHLSFIIILVALFFPLVQTRLLGSSSHEVASVTERASGYGEALQIFKTQPWLGVGAGNYTLATYKLNSNLSTWEYQPVHNVGLLFLAELGIIGVLLLIFVIANLFRFKILDYKLLVLFLIPYSLLLIFDHYLYTSYVGLALSGIYWGLFARLVTRDFHS